MANSISTDLLDLFESLLRAQINAVRQLRRTPVSEKRAPRIESMSQIEIVYNILETAKHPLHVDVIIEQAQKKFSRQLDKESIVSALTKRVKRQDRFVKTAPNTFSLITRESEGGRR